MSEGFQVQNASYQAWIAPDCTIRQSRPLVGTGDEARPFNSDDLSEWVQLCRRGYVYVCYGPISTMFLYGRADDLKRTEAQWKALATSVDHVRVTLVGDGTVDFIDAAEFEVPSAIDNLTGFIRENG